MPTRLSKKKLDEAESLNSLAAHIATQTTGQTPPKLDATPSDIMAGLAKIRASNNTPIREKNPAAVALGRLGASKGGKARAESLSVEQRKAIAQKAASARWKTHSKAGS
jgi:hypothetical protein